MNGRIAGKSPRIKEDLIILICLRKGFFHIMAARNDHVSLDLFIFIKNSFLVSKYHVKTKRNGIEGKTCLLTLNGRKHSALSKEKYDPGITNFSTIIHKRNHRGNLTPTHHFIDK